MTNPTALKAFELSTRALLISKEIVVEEDNLKHALENNLGAEQVEAIKSKIGFLKRKQTLFQQVAKLKGHQN